MARQSRHEMILRTYIHTYGVHHTCVALEPIAHGRLSPVTTAADTWAFQERAVQQGRAMAQRGARAGWEAQERQERERLSDSGGLGEEQEPPNEGREEEEEEKEDQQMRDR